MEDIVLSIVNGHSDVLGKALSRSNGQAGLSEDKWQFLGLCCNRAFLKIVKSLSFPRGVNLKRCRYGSIPSGTFLNYVFLWVIEKDFSKKSCVIVLHGVVDAHV